MSRPFDLQIRALVEAVAGIAECIHDSGSVPSGHLYARVMGHMDIDSYQSVIDTLVRAGLVRERPGQLLEWIGPSGSTDKPKN